MNGQFLQHLIIYSALWVARLWHFKCHWHCYFKPECSKRAVGWGFGESFSASSGHLFCWGECKTLSPDFHPIICLFIAIYRSTKLLLLI